MRRYWAPRRPRSRLGRPKDPERRAAWTPQQRPHRRRIPSPSRPFRYQPASGLAAWFRQRLGDAGGCMRKVLVVALARKLLIALWRFATQGLVPQGAAARTA